MNIIGKRKIWFTIWGIFFVLSVLGIAFRGLKTGLDFTGGSFWEIEGIEDKEKVKEVLNNFKADVISIDKDGLKLKIKTKVLKEEDHKKILDEFKNINASKEVKELKFETIGATVSRDITEKAYISIALASLLIILYVGWSFRKVSKPVASWKYGVCAVLAILHDVLFVVGIFSILGLLFKTEIDSLFVTALLTVISFSVHDTIVIFDRIKENLKRSEKEDFEEIVNDSVLEMIARSINTSLVIILVVLALFLIGGETIKTFVLALLLGLITGTYSSVFIASPFLVVWKNWDDKRAQKKISKL